MAVEGTDITTAPNRLPLTMMFDRMSADFLLAFLDACARSMMTQKPLAVDAYAAFQCFASRVCETPAFARLRIQQFSHSEILYNFSAYPQKILQPLLKI